MPLEYGRLLLLKRFKFTSLLKEIFSARSDKSMLYQSQLTFFLRFHFKIITKRIHREVLRPNKSKRYSYVYAYELITKITKIVCIIQMHLHCKDKHKRLNDTDYQNCRLTSQSSTHLLLKLLKQSVYELITNISVVKQSESFRCISVVLVNTNV